MVLLCDSYDSMRAECLKLELEGKGIRALLVKADFGGQRPALDFVTPVRIMVPETQLESARQVLLDFESIP